MVLNDPANQNFIPPSRGAGLVRTGGVWHCEAEGEDTDLGENLKPFRKFDLLNDLYSLGLKSPVFMDMNDAVRDANAFPVFQYNRLNGAHNSILWPLKRFHAPGGVNFCSHPDPSENALSEKKSKIVWRGVLRGFSTYGGSARNVSAVVSAFLAEKMDKETLLAHLNTVPRYAFVSRYFDDPRFDVGFFVPEPRRYFTKIPEIARLEKPYLSQGEQLQNKYQMAIQGTDVASSFGWQLGSNCVILREPYSWEVFFDTHFEAWEHYVPIAADFGDIPEKVEWCEKNQDACLRMVEKRHAVVRLLLDMDARREALRRVVARYNDFYEAWRS